ncbi:MAG: hypothetical protein JOZ12_05230 [Sinobacteraceae bacterium]|nr:hypothetical protein [Nevskiaceae bacterium]
MDHAIMLEKYGESGIVPAGNGRLTDGGMLFSRGAEVLFDIGHGTAALRALDGGVAQGNLIINDQSLGKGGTDTGQAAQQSNQQAHFHDRDLVRADVRAIGSGRRRSTWGPSSAASSSCAAELLTSARRASK